MGIIVSFGKRHNNHTNTVRVPVTSLATLATVHKLVKPDAARLEKVLTILREGVMTCPDTLDAIVPYYIQQYIDELEPMEAAKANQYMMYAGLGHPLGTDHLTCNAE